MVLSLAFSANNPFVYSLAIFIVATLVTDLDFLEKIAALFWNRDKYWEYRMGRMPPSEVKKRAKQEAWQEFVSNRSVPSGIQGNTVHYKEASADFVSRYTAQALSFEKAVNDAIAAGKGPFEADRVITNRVLRSDFSVFQFDAIAETSSADYVIEIKYSKRPHVLSNLLSTALRGVDAYRNYLNERGIEKEVIPVGIVPDGVSTPSLFEGALPILKFDSDRGEFVNEEEFCDAVQALRESGA